MKEARLSIACVALGGTALCAQMPDNLWLRPSAIPDLRMFVGGMVITIPPYPGSRESRSVPFPVLYGEWRERVTFGSSRFGVGGSLAANYFKHGPFTANVGLEVVEARRERMADALAGMGDRPAAFFASTGLAWRYGPLELYWGLREGFKPEAGGGTVLRAALTLPLGRRWLIETRIAASAYDRPQMAYEFGISHDQAAERLRLVQAGDPRLVAPQTGPFAPSGGMALLQSSLAIGYALTDHWRLGLTLLEQRVQGRAQSSPLVLEPRGRGIVFGLSYQL